MFLHSRIVAFIGQLVAIFVSTSCSGLWAQTAFPPVEVARVTVAQVNTGHRVVGTVSPLRTSTIGSAIGGRVKAFYVNQGQAVQAGDPLAQLRTETLEIELLGAKAELDLYQQQLNELENGSRPEEVAEAKARALIAKAAMNNAANQLVRMNELSASRAATDADQENASERAESTKYLYEATSAMLRRIEAGPRIEQVAQAKAQVDLQMQNVRMIEDRIKKHTIIAPFDGFVSAEYTELGAWIGSGDPVAQVIQLDEVEITAPATAAIATKLHRGDSVRVEFPELPTKLLTGSIDRIVPIAESRARTFPILIRMHNEIINGEPLLLSGMLARVELPAGSQTMLPLVPKDSLVLSDQDCSVFVVTPDADTNTGTVRKIDVRLGIASGNRIQVYGGVEDNDLVVVVGNERLADDTKVSIAGIVDLNAASQ